MGGFPHTCSQRNSFILAVAFACIIIIAPLLSTGTSAVTIDSTEHNVLLYLRAANNGTLSTQPPTSQTGNLDTMGSGGISEFTFEELLGDLTVKGQSLSSSPRRGLILNLRTVPTGSPSMNISIFDDDTKVAAAEFDAAALGTVQKEIPFTDASKTEHTFTIGSELKIRMDVTAPQFNGVVIHYDSTTNDGHLVLNCNQMTFGNDTLLILDGNDEPTEEFTPNHPNQEKLVRFKGEAFDALGAVDIDRVDIEVKGQTGVQLLETMNLSRSEGVVKYDLDWAYPEGIPSGIYTATISIVDNSGNKHNVSDQFSFASNGVFLTTDDDKKSAANGRSVVFNVDVYNTGGSQDSIKVSYPPDIGWAVTLSKDSMVVEAGEFESITVTVMIPSTASPGQEKIFNLKGASQSSGKFDELPLTVTAVSKFDFGFTAVGETTYSLEPGTSYTFEIEVENMGEGEDTYDIFIEEEPAEGWGAVLSSDSSTDGTDHYRSIELPLESGMTETVSVQVTVSEAPAVQSIELEVKAQSRNDPKNALKNVTYSVVTIVDWSDAVKFEGSPTVTAAVVDKEAQTYSSVEFDLSITNVEARNIEVIITYEIDDGFLVGVSPKKFTLIQGGEREIKVTVKIDAKKKAGKEPLKLTFSENGVTGGNLYVVMNAEITIPEIHSFEWEVKDDSLVIDEERGSVEFDVTIFNMGNLDEKSIELVIQTDEIDKNWNVTIPVEDRIQTIIRNGNATFKVKVKLQGDVESGDVYKFKVKVKDTNEMSKTLKVTADIQPRYLSFFVRYPWIIIGMILVVGIGIYLRYKQLS